MKQSKQEVKLETVTPEFAQNLLSKNENNRNMANPWVSFYASQMTAGNWQVTGDTIKVSTEGILLDGQHRLMAVVKSGKTVQMYVAYGISAEAYKVMDTGKRRSTGDNMHVAGLKDVNALASTVRIIMNFNREYYAAYGTSGQRISDTEMIQFVNEHPEIAEHMTIGNSIQKQFSIGPSRTIISALHYIFEQKSPADTHTFFVKYSKGLDLKENDPIRRLRDKLMLARTGKKFTQREMLSIFVYAWNAFREKRELSRINVVGTADSFPRLS